MTEDREPPGDQPSPEKQPIEPPAKDEPRDKGRAKDEPGGPVHPEPPPSRPKPSSGPPKTLGSVLRSKRVRTLGKLLGEALGVLAAVATILAAVVAVLMWIEPKVGGNSQSGQQPGATAAERGRPLSSEQLADRLDELCRVRRDSAARFSEDWLKSPRTDRQLAKDLKADADRFLAELRSLTASRPQTGALRDAFAAERAYRDNALAAITAHESGLNGQAEVAYARLNRADAGAAYERLKSPVCVKLAEVESLAAGADLAAMREAGVNPKDVARSTLAWLYCPKYEQKPTLRPSQYHWVLDELARRAAAAPAEKVLTSIYDPRRARQLRETEIAAQRVTREQEIGLQVRKLVICGDVPRARRLERLAGRTSFFPTRDEESGGAAFERWLLVRKTLGGTLDQADEAMEQFTVALEQGKDDEAAELIRSAKFGFIELIVFTESERLTVPRSPARPGQDIFLKLAETALGAVIAMEDELGPKGSMDAYFAAMDRYNRARRLLTQERAALEAAVPD